MKRFRLASLTFPTFAAAATICMASNSARAHPHVWITAQVEVVFSASVATAIRHRWTFDPGYSAYVTQGLAKNADGKLVPDELLQLAKDNVESLADFEYFTALKANGAKQAFDPPRDYGTVFENGQVTLHFLLPLKAPASGKLLNLEIYDPTFFVAFRRGGIRRGPIWQSRTARPPASSAVSLRSCQWRATRRPSRFVPA